MCLFQSRVYTDQSSSHNTSEKMKTFISLLVIACGLSLATAASQATNCSQKWDFAKIQFTIGGGLKQNLLPRWLASEDSSVKQSIEVSTLSDQTCNNTLDNGYYYGIAGRIEQGGNNSNIVILYDIRGKISGVQLRLNSTEVGTVGFNYTIVPSFQRVTINNTLFYYVTAYFVAEPEKICSTGRSDAEFNAQGTGSRFTLQNGSTPSYLLEGPLCRNVAITAPNNFTSNHCFAGMGSHTFYAVSTWQADSCKSITPVFLLFDRQGRLSGFGFDITGKANNKYFEHPPESVIETIVGKGAGETPECLKQLARDDKLTTLHFFFVRDTYDCIG